ncbi:MAG: cobyric acid synthase [Candidatus Bathyarchaeia archaeon]
MKLTSNMALKGQDRSCPYYPCHFEGQDCTWCFCPFYPCGDERTGGGPLKKSGGEVWSCERCVIIHKRSVAEKVLKALSGKRPAKGWMRKSELKSLFNKVVIPSLNDKARALMVQGTSSHSGKTLVAALICQALRERGYSVAPFKAQNMSLNSFVTNDGGEVAWAQAFQAFASGLEPTREMNPILLKPKGLGTSQVVLMGKPYRDMSVEEYYGWFALSVGLRHIEDALNRLRTLYDFVVIEGAGSPAEINLEPFEIVNMRVAEMADAPVILVADIDRGGVFASIAGTLMLLKKKHRQRVKGVIINKFRGNEAILTPGVKTVERLTGKPVIGILPYVEELIIPQEDSVSLQASPRTEGAVDFAVIKLPRISNFTDFDALTLSGMKIRYVSHPLDLGEPDVIIIPGTKNTLGDLAWMRRNGLAEKVLEAAGKRVPIIGICGGFQILGEKIVDEGGVESEHPVEAQGLGLVKVTTRFREYKKTAKRVKARVIGPGPILESARGETLEGYEIHMGETSLNQGTAPLLQIIDDRAPRVDGAVDRSGLIFGTYLHGLFDQPPIRDALAKYLFKLKGVKHQPLRTKEYREAWANSLRKLMDTFAVKVNLPYLFSLLGVEVVNTP